MKKKIKTFDEICKLSVSLKKEGKRVVFCHGCFDILHLGHVDLFSKAKASGDILVVGVESDNNTKHYKGDTRPVHSQKARMTLLSFLEPIDYVFGFEDIENFDDIDGVLAAYCKKLSPSVYATGSFKDKYVENKRKRAKDIGMDFVEVKGKYSKDTSRILSIIGYEL